MEFGDKVIGAVVACEEMESERDENKDFLVYFYTINVLFFLTM